MIIQKTYILFIVFICLTFKCNFVYSQKYSEYEVKAAYVFNFAQFVQWPESSFKTDTSSFVLGILGTDVFGAILNKTFLVNKIRNRKWIVKFFKTVDDVKDCHVLFVSNISPSELDKLIKKIEDKPILTVGNTIPLFCENGGMINFTPQDDAKRFEVNMDSALRTKISISSKLLSLAKVVSSKAVKF